MVRKLHSKTVFRADSCYKEYRPMIPILGVFILGILVDHFFLTPGEVEISLSSVFWGWVCLLTVSFWIARLFVKNFIARKKWELQHLNDWGIPPERGSALESTESTESTDSTDSTECYISCWEKFGRIFLKLGCGFLKSAPLRCAKRYGFYFKKTLEVTTASVVLQRKNDGETKSENESGIKKYLPAFLKDPSFRKEWQRSNMSGTVFILVAYFAFGGFFHHLYWNYYPPTEIGLYSGDPFSLQCIEGKITRPPQYVYPCDELRFSKTEKDVVTVLNVAVYARKKGTRWVSATGNLIVRVLGKVENIHAGEIWQMSGRMSQLSDAMNPHAFSPRIYYRQQRILAVLRVPTPQNPQLVYRPKFWGVFRFVEFLQSQASERLERFLTSETRPMAEALILGCREEISDEDLNQMLETGTIHIMAISGLHVGLLGGGFFLFCRLLGLNRFWTMIVILFCIWLYVMVSGSRPPAVRAGVLVTISTIGYWLARRSSHLNSLATAGMVVLLMNPTALFSTGTQLSFLAVGTLIFTPYLHGFSTKKREKTEKEKELEQRLAPEYLLVSGAPHAAILKRLFHRMGVSLLNLLYSSFQMTVVLMPLVVHAFHVAAFVGIFLNILLWPPLMIAMMSGIGVVLLGNFWGIGPFCGYLCSSALSVMNSMICWGAQLPGHCIWMQGTPAFWNFILYSLLISWAIFPNLRFKKRRNYAIVFGIMLLILIPFWECKSSGKGELQCSFISVSHGLSILVQLPNGKTILYDAGQFAPAQFPARTISEFLWNSGVHHLDAIVISHADMDHYNALPNILSRFSADVIYVSPQIASTFEASTRQNTLESTQENTRENTQENQNKTENSALNKQNETNKNSLVFVQNTEKTTSEFVMKDGIDWRKRQEEVKEETSLMLSKLFGAITERHIPIRCVEAGTVIPIDDECQLRVLHPSRESLEAEPDKTNSNSVVLLLEYDGCRFLLTGDLAPPGLERFLSTEPISCDVVLAPHHGGRTCCTPELAAWCNPKHFIICDSYKNQQIRTAEIFSESGAKIYHTGREGAVIFRVRDGNLTVFTRNEWKDWY